MPQLSLVTIGAGGRTRDDRGVRRARVGAGPRRVHGGPDRRRPARRRVRAADPGAAVRDERCGRCSSRWSTRPWRISRPSFRQRDVARPDGKFHTPVRTDEIAAELDQAQYETQGGPCVASRGPTVPRWLTGRDLATTAGGRSSRPHRRARRVRLGPGHDAAAQRTPGPSYAGALNMYSRRPARRSTTADVDRACCSPRTRRWRWRRRHAVAAADLERSQLRSGDRRRAT